MKILLLILVESPVVVFIAFLSTIVHYLHLPIKITELSNRKTQPKTEKEIEKEIGKRLIKIREKRIGTFGSRGYFHDFMEKLVKYSIAIKKQLGLRENSRDFLEEVRHESEKLYKLYYSRETKNISINCFRREHNKVLTRPRRKFCARRTNYFDSQSFPEICSLGLGEIGEDLTLFDCMVEDFLKFEADEIGSDKRMCFFRDFIRAYQDPDKRMNRWGEFGIRRDDKLLMINEFRKIRCFLERYQGDIILNFPEEQAFLKNKFLKQEYIYRKYIYIFSGKKLLLDFSLINRNKAIGNLRIVLRDILQIENLDEEVEILENCANFFLARKMGIGPELEHVQERILYNLAPNIPESYLRENFLPLGYRK